MVPHEPVKSTRSAIQAAEPASCPSNCVSYPTRSQPVELALVAVSQRVPELDQVLVIRLIATT